MKPFDLDKAKSGHLIVTRLGDSAKVLVTVPEYSNAFVAFINASIGPTIHDANGQCIVPLRPSLDLFLAAEKKTGWVNVYPPAVYSSEYRTMGLIFPSKEQADNSTRADRLACIQISWEE